MVPAAALSSGAALSVTERDPVNGERVRRDAEGGAAQRLLTLILLEDRDLTARAQVDPRGLDQLLELRLDRVRSAALGEDAREGAAVTAQEVGQVEGELAEQGVAERRAGEAVSDGPLVDRALPQAGADEVDLVLPAVAIPGAGRQALECPTVEVEGDEQVAHRPLDVGAVAEEQARLVQLERDRARAVVVAANPSDVDEEVATGAGLTGHVHALEVDLVVRDGTGLDRRIRVILLGAFRVGVIGLAGRKVMLGDDPEAWRTPVTLGRAGAVVVDQVAVGRVEGAAGTARWSSQSPSAQWAPPRGH